MTTFRVRRCKACGTKSAKNKHHLRINSRVFGVCWICKPCAQRVGLWAEKEQRP